MVSKDEVSIQVQEEVARLAREKAEIDGLIEWYNNTRDQLDRITTHLNRDKKRLFRRILHDSLPIYGAQIQSLRLEIDRLESKLDGLGIELNDFRYEGRRAMR
ncbi:MAG: hypothetical protein ACRC78_04175 [Planktothrix sp.]